MTNKTKIEIKQTLDYKVSDFKNDIKMDKMYICAFSQRVK